jgi:hypothetical protein
MDTSLLIQNRWYSYVVTRHAASLTFLLQPVLAFQTGTRPTTIHIDIDLSPVSISELIYTHDDACHSAARPSFPLSNGTGKYPVLTQNTLSVLFNSK